MSGVTNHHSGVSQTNGRRSLSVTDPACARTALASQGAKQLTLSRDGVRFQCFAALAWLHCSGWDEDVQYHSAAGRLRRDDCGLPPRHVNPAKRQREQKVLDRQGRYLILGAQKVSLPIGGLPVATGCGEEAHSYQEYISPMIYFKIEKTNPKTHPNSPSPPQWRLGTNTTSLRLLRSDWLEKCRACQHSTRTYSKSYE
jgi:hypothetical protein